MNTLTAEIEKRYPGGTVIRASIDRSTDQFSVTVLFGPSGCGKTTILRCLAGLERPDRGRIRFNGEVWSDAAEGVFIPPQRRGIGYLFQEYALFPHLSVAANIAYGLSELPRRERCQRTGELLDMLNLTGLENRSPGRLSGGEQQRVALARALAHRPRLLLLDEPLSALDAPTREHLRRELRRQLAEFAIPCFIVTHDRHEALSLGDHLMVMEQGSVRQAGPLHEVFSHPANAHVAMMVGVETILQARVEREEGGLATLMVEGEHGRETQLIAVAQAAQGRRVFACIRGEEVAIDTSTQTGGSARNHLPARVLSMDPEGPLVRVTLDCGFRLVAVITRQAGAELGLREGGEVIARIKAPAIHVVTR